MRFIKSSIRLALLFVLVFILSARHAYADHLKGGWIKYTYVSSTSDRIIYNVSFYQYSDCGQPEKVDNAIYMSVYDAATSVQIGTPNLIGLTRLTTESKSDFGPCFQNPPLACYLIAEYTTSITVPKNENGYVFTVQRCCRIESIANVPNSNSTGLTYTVTIPGGANANDNSPVFDFNETAAICYGSPFAFDFSATDIDGDSLVYSLCSGLTGGTQFEPVVTDPPPPPYSSIPYNSPYSGTSPLGADVSIDPKTGQVSGIAPMQLGTYVAAVCVDEYRNGKYISHTRKELHLNVSNCKLGGARLKPSYVNCDSLGFTFTNEAGENANYHYLWDFGVLSSDKDTSSNPHPTFVYPDTGTYTVRLKAQNDAGCEDSAEAQIKIYPGFTTDFSITGSCIKNPYLFTDLTATRYGVVDSWKWFFTNEGYPDDTSKNSTYTYADTGLKSIMLITTSSKGCIDTATKTLQVNYGPHLNLSFRDTLICNIDTLQLHALSEPGAVFSWLPLYNITGANTSSPSVFPKQTTTYNVLASYQGCETTDSVTVNVIDHVSLSLPADTTICKTDSVKLVPVSNALYFSWSPAARFRNPSEEYPVIAPLQNTTYTLAASVGKCMATASTNINVVPYPAANAGADVSVCFGNITQLNANIEGSSFYWTPTIGLLNANSLTTVAGPQSTTTYVLHVSDTAGCPKPVTDTIVVTVIPKVQAFAGNDTAIVRAQPLQLNATGGTLYKWTPLTYLSDANIANPVGTFTEAPDTVSYNVKVSTPEGCFANDSIKIFVFATGPEVFIPTAFTPNGDGRNDVFRPTVAGMKTLLGFRIYNRWGQLLFSTEEQNKGWDGNFNGRRQPSGTYVFSIQAIDYNGKPYFKKGTFVLIR